MIEEENDIAAYEPSDWVVDLLQLHESTTTGNLPLDEVFTKRCADAAELALNLSKLRRERQRVGFIPLPAIDYLQRLVELAEIPQSTCLPWLGEDSSITTTERAAAFAQLAQRIGMSLREALAHLRITFSAQLGLSPVPLLLARTRTAVPTADPIKACEVLLQEIESGYDISNLRQLRLLEFELSTLYDRANNDRA